MAVVIDEISSEVAPEAQASRGSGGGSGGGGAGGGAEPDLDKLDYQIRRALQRRARLFAD
ncbi:MAG: hypothetical protein JO013_10175 [Alphaproteobacteria bacterium]|nr:hypothetical protein [Alphaproteobacteria bacterium]